MSKSLTARDVALDALLQMEKNEGYSNLVIDKALKAAGLDRRDGALASTIFYGVLEKKLTLDYFISQCLRTPSKKLDKTVNMALRCGAYQILYLDRVPDSAAVNEAVNGIKGRGRAAYSGFVNGVLRSMIRRKGEFSLPEGDSLRALSLRYSVPQGLVSLWIKAYGRDITRRLLGSLTEQAPIYLRVNSQKTTSDALAGSLAERGVLFERYQTPPETGILRGASPAGLPEFEEGLFHVQDLSAQLVCEILDPRPGENVCDCCAAPGGKTFTVAEKMEGKGSVTALDLYKGRTRLIEDGARRLGLVNVTAKTADLTKPVENLPPMDRVLCDAPCSGFGVIRRKPEIRYKDLSCLDELPELQTAILKNAARLVRPGGTLVYSTCTLDPRENGEVAERFLQENNDFIPMKIELPAVRRGGDEGSGGTGLSRCIDEPSHHLTMMPFAGASDVFFAAAFRKKT